MGTKCVSLRTDLFSSCYHKDFSHDVTLDYKQAEITVAFNSTSRYIDDFSLIQSYDQSKSSTLISNEHGQSYRSPLIDSNF